MSTQTKPIAELKAKLDSALATVQDTVKKAQTETSAASITEALVKIAGDLSAVVDSAKTVHDEDFMPAEQANLLKTQIAELKAMVEDGKKKELATKLAQYFPKSEEKIAEFMKKDYPALLAQMEVISEFAKSVPARTAQVRNTGVRIASLSEMANEDNRSNGGFYF